jgi:hypothetical protein
MEISGVSTQRPLLACPHFRFDEGIQRGLQYVGDFLLAGSAKRINPPLLLFVAAAGLRFVVAAESQEI